MRIGWQGRGALACAAGTLALTACHASSSGQATPSLVPSGAVTISAAAWTDGEWPFTVPQGELRCYVDDSMVTFTADGIEYGLNGTAKVFGGFRDIDEIRPGESAYVELDGKRQWVDGHPIPTASAVSRGQKLCPPISVEAN